MKPIIVIELPLGMGIDREITEPYGYDLFYGDENIEAQWEKLEKLRETGGVIVVQPSHTSAVREILDPYIGEDGFIKECGLRKVHTEEHGDFCIILYHNPSEVMALRAFYLNSKKKKSSFARRAMRPYRKSLTAISTPRLFLRWQNRLKRKEARMSDKLLEVVQDHTSLVQALQFILEAAETKKLPPYGVLPVFNDDLLNDRLKGILELVTGEKYP